MEYKCQKFVGRTYLVGWLVTYVCVGMWVGKYNALVGIYDTGVVSITYVTQVVTITYITQVATITYVTQVASITYVV